MASNDEVASVPSSVMRSTNTALVSSPVREDTRKTLVSETIPALRMITSTILPSTRTAVFSHVTAS